MFECFISIIPSCYPLRHTHVPLTAKLGVHEQNRAIYLALLEEVKALTERPIGHVIILRRIGFEP